MNTESIKKRYAKLPDPKLKDLSKKILSIEPSYQELLISELENRGFSNLVQDINEVLALEKRVSETKEFTEAELERLEAFGFDGNELKISFILEKRNAQAKSEKATLSLLKKIENLIFQRDFPFKKVISLLENKNSFDESELTSCLNVLKKRRKKYVAGGVGFLVLGLIQGFSLSYVLIRGGKPSVFSLVILVFIGFGIYFLIKSKQAKKMSDFVNYWLEDKQNKMGS